MPDNTKLILRARIAALSSWATELYTHALPDRRVLSLLEEAPRQTVLYEVEVYFGDWSPAAARIVSGRRITDQQALATSLQRSVFDLPHARDIFEAKEQAGCQTFRRYMEVIEMLRRAMLDWLALDGQ